VEGPIFHISVNNRFFVLPHFLYSMIIPIFDNADSLRLFLTRPHWDGFHAIPTFVLMETEHVARLEIIDRSFRMNLTYASIHLTTVFYVIPIELAMLA